MFRPVYYTDPTGHFWWFFALIFKAIAAFSIAHPIMFGAAMGGLLGGVNAAVTGQNIFAGIGLGVLGGMVGGAVSAGVSGFLKPAIGKMWSGLAGVGLGGSSAGAATAGVAGADAGLGALSGLASGVVGFVGGYNGAPGLGQIAGNVASAAVTGDDLGDAAFQGFVSASVNATVGTLLPEQTIGEQGTAGPGDLIFYKGGGLTDPVGIFLSILQGAPITHDAVATSATRQVDSHVKGGVKDRPIDFNRQGRLVKWSGSGNQKFVALVTQYGKDNAFKYWLGPRREICSTFIGRAAGGSGLSVPGFSPSSQYYNMTNGIQYYQVHGVQNQ